jgi:hypothetical protein
MNNMCGRYNTSSYQTDYRISKIPTLYIVYSFTEWQSVVHHFFLSGWHGHQRPPAKRADIATCCDRFLEAFPMKDMSTGGSSGSTRFDVF